MEHAREESATTNGSKGRYQYQAAGSYTEGAVGLMPVVMPFRDMVNQQTQKDEAEECKGSGQR